MNNYNTRHATNLSLLKPFASPTPNVKIFKAAGPKAIIDTCETMFKISLCFCYNKL